MELAMAILSAVAAVAAAVTALLTYLNGKKMENGSVELQIRTMISEAKYHCCEAVIEAERNPENTKLKQICEALQEDVLNAYDEACAKYSDRKVDKERFKQTYFHEIRQIVENKKFSEKYNSVSTRYGATLRVYQEWHQQQG